MADETAQQVSSDDSAAQPGDAWGDPISEERQAYLRELFERQKVWAAQPEATRGASVFNGVGLTGADVFWLAEWSVREWSVLDMKTGLPLPSLHLEGAGLGGAQLQRANLRKAHLERASLDLAQLEGADLFSAYLQRADLNGTELQGANLHAANLERANLHAANLERAFLFGAQMAGAFLYAAQLAGANLRGAQLAGADLREAQLAGTDLQGAQLAGADLQGAQLEGANLTSGKFDKTTHLNDAVLTGASLDQVTYDGVNLTVVDWSRVPVLGDELAARQRKDEDRKRKARTRRLNEFTAAVRTNRVLAVTLRSQGMNEDADRYAYRAQLLQRTLLRLRLRWGSAFGSWLLDLVSGYGYRPIRSVFTYMFVVIAFAVAYFILGGTHGALTWNEALVVSMTAFHGRGFFGSAFQPGDPQAAVAAVEALIGLLIEITFIATFTNRFFAR